MKKRSSWDEYFMFSALSIAVRSSCLYLQTGAVIVKDKRIIAKGYNGAPPGIKNCLEVGCRKDREGINFEDKEKNVCRGIHAEINAMNQIARQDLKNTTLFSIYYPCSVCAKAIVGAGIKEVVYLMNYKELDSLTEELFSEKKLRLRRLELNIEDYFNKIRGVYKINCNLS